MVELQVSETITDTWSVGTTTTGTSGILGIIQSVSFSVTSSWTHSTEKTISQKTKMTINPGQKVSGLALSAADIVIDLRFRLDS